MKTFNDLSIGDPFNMNGSHWEKKSTRTAYLLDKHGVNPTVFVKSKLWFYFGANEKVTNFKA